ncbi:YtxH domain-containing protein [Flavobacterium sp.]|uniref:YtxH domain-containing protein n=1 Tax=Flavobacterium sp. TaxID=239 RepID=UPI00374CE6D3
MESSKVVLGVISGVAVGALLGVLFAPHKGSKTRKKMANTGKQYTDELKGKAENLYQEVTNKYENLKEEIERMMTKNEEAI